jgi:hypothetical protein
MLNGFQEAIEFLNGNHILSLTSNQELEFLYQNVYYHSKYFTHQKVYDLGTRNGASAIVMAKALADFTKDYSIFYQDAAEVYSIDFGGPFGPVHTLFDFEKVTQAFNLFFDLYGVKIQCIVDYDYNVIKAAIDNSITFIYHDSSHDYEHLKGMLELSLLKCRKGSIICGHDYCQFDADVIKAVDEFREQSNKIVSFGVFCNLWWVVKS